MVTPRMGTIFGCAERLDITATWRKAYRMCVTSPFENKGKYNRVHTSFTLRESPPECALTRLIRTFEPLKVPSYTHPMRDSWSDHDFGNTSLTRHRYPSSRRDSRNTGIAWLEMSTTT